MKNLIKIYFNFFLNQFDMLYIAITKKKIILLETKIIYKNKQNN